MTDRTAAGSPAWIRLIIDHNPLFLLSAICMMFGCHVLNLALYTPAGDIRKLLILLAVVNLYETALIGLGTALLRRNGLERRDAHTLMGLEALFLADTTFIAGVISTIDARWGWGLNAVLLSLAAIKVLLVGSALRLPRANHVTSLVVLQLLVALLTPTIFKQIAMTHRGFLPELAVYLAWWVAGLVPVVAAAVLWPRKQPASPAHKSQIVLAGIYLVVPFLSVLMHVYGAGWVYNFYLASAELSPILLGLAVALSAWHAHRPTTHVSNWQVALIVAANLCAMYGDLSPGKTNVRSSISFELLGLHITAVRMTLVASALVILHMIWLHNRLHAILTAAAGAIAIVLWPNLPAIWASLASGARGVGRLLSMLVPKTAAAWGITCVVASFVLLGIGAAFSFRRKSPPPAEPHRAETAYTSDPS